MKKLWVIIQREYFSRVKKRSFLLTTLLVPILIAGFYALMIWLAVADNGESKRIAVIDESGYFNQKLSNSKSVVFTYPTENFESIKEDFKKSDYSGVLYIPEIDIFKVNDNIKFYSTERIGPGPKDHIVDELKQRIRKLRMDELNISNELLNDLEVSLTLPELGIEEDGGKRAASEMLSLIGFVIAFLLYFVLILFGTMVMRGVKEEKTNRIVEVIISSVKPFQLMFGKIVGISFVGLTQFLIWGILGYVSYIFLMPFALDKMSLDPSILDSSSGSTESMAELEGIESLFISLANFNYGKLFISFIFYFLGGYFIYASMFSAVGSVVEDDNESQQLVLPVMMPIIISVAIVTSIMNDPNNPIAVWSSIVPLTSPIVMPSRIPFDPPMWQIIASVVSLIAGVIFFVWLSAKIYRIGILMYGKKVNFKELLKWIRY